MSAVGETKLSAVLERPSDVRLSGGAYSAICPVHKDRKASLRVSMREDGGVLVFCHAGCSFEKVMQAIGVIGTDEPSEMLQRSERAPLRQHVYTESNGTPIAIKLK